VSLNRLEQDNGNDFLNRWSDRKNGAYENFNVSTQCSDLSPLGSHHLKVFKTTGSAPALDAHGCRLEPMTGVGDARATQGLRDRH
jgi:hypothetical protein